MPKVSWREVETGARHTVKTAMEKFPQLTDYMLKDLPSGVARQSKGDHVNSRARNVKTYLVSDVDDLVARLAAPPEPDAVDPRWREVETGTRHTVKTAMERYPQLTEHSVEGLPSEIATKPKRGNQAARDVKTYLAVDVDALVARLAAPEPVDPRWLEVEAGRRYDRKTALKRYPQLYAVLFADLPFEIARRPKMGKAKYACDVFTYATADVEKLAAARANKRARVQEPELPQEPEPEEEEAEECPICLDPMTGATATLVCGHLFHKHCITDWARSQATCPTCRQTLQFAP